MPHAPISRPTSSWATSRECWATAASRTSVVPREGACRTPTPCPRSRLPPAARRNRRGRAPPRACYAFLTPTALAPRLVEAGFTHFNLANNHANDFGSDGRATTERILDSLGLRTYGPLGSIAVDTLRRGDSATVVGLVGFTTYPHSYDLLDIARSASVIDSVRALVDLLVVTFHGGRRALEHSTSPKPPNPSGASPEVICGPGRAP